MSVIRKFYVLFIVKQILKFAVYIYCVCHLDHEEINTDSAETEIYRFTNLKEELDESKQEIRKLKEDKAELTDKHDKLQSM